jgi:Amidase
MSVAAERANYRNAIGTAASKLRIGILRKPFFDDLDPEIRTTSESAIAVIFARVDLLVTPTTMSMPPTIASATADPTSEISLIRNTVPFNVLGIPTISVPCGFSRAGLPIGLQITGPRLGEARVLALAHAYEQATEWHRRMPSI